MDANYVSKWPGMVDRLTHIAEFPHLVVLAVVVIAPIDREDDHIRDHDRGRGLVHRAGEEDHIQDHEVAVEVVPIKVDQDLDRRRIPDLAAVNITVAVHLHRVKGRNGAAPVVEEVRGVAVPVGRERAILAVAVLSVQDAVQIDVVKVATEAKVVLVLTPVAASEVVVVEAVLVVYHVKIPNPEAEVGPLTAGAVLLKHCQTEVVTTITISSSRRRRKTECLKFGGKRKSQKKKRKYNHNRTLIILAAGEMNGLHLL